MESQQGKIVLRADIRTRQYAAPGFKRQVVLRDLKLEFEAGTMVVLGGGTGIAQRVLGQTLTGVDYVWLDGEVRLEGVELQEDWDWFENHAVCAVLNGAEDNMDVGFLLRTAALPGCRTKEEGQRMLAWTKELIRLLGLEQVQDTKFRKLTLMQKRLTEFGRRIVRIPSFVYVEPWERELTEQESTVFYMTLRRLTRELGMCILVSPSAPIPPEAFDRVICLSEDGRLAFDGTVREFDAWADTQP